MRILRTVQSELADLGLVSTQSSIIDQKNVIGILSPFLGFILSGACIFSKPNTFQEYTLLAYTSSSYLLVAIIFAIFSWNNQTISKFIDSAEQTVNKYELKYSTV